MDFLRDFFNSMDRNTILIVVGAIAVLFLVFISLRGNSLSKAVKQTRETKDIKHVVNFIDGDPKADIPTLYNSAIKTLWDGYDRDIAMRLIGELLKRNDTAPISQQWIQTALTVEPELARTELGKDFINAHYREDVAKACAGCGGACGSCK